MSSPKLNLPFLSPYLFGEVMSSHSGVSCYPAIRRGTEEKYILKVISVPASASMLDALLLTGAMDSKEAALDYFETLSQDIIRQTDILRDLSQQEGFVPYLDAQIVPMEDGAGFYVYLLGSYRHSLERVLRTDALTHAEAAGLGLDLCAALAACRRTGYLYADLKPGNIFRDPEHGFRIGDVGFISLQSLKYASLPAKYRSSYSAPELSDDMAVLNSTVDIYALGLVLYQTYNGGILPYPDIEPGKIPPPPIYADYEMAAIILKACHPDPNERWQEPTQMAHALIDYLQTYGAPETPIIPPALEEPEDTDEEDPFLPEADPEQLQQEIADLENAAPEELAFLAQLVSDETAPSEENTADVPDDVMTEELSEMLAQADELLSHELPEPPVAPEPVFAPMPEPIMLDENGEVIPQPEETEAEVPSAVEEAPAEAEPIPDEQEPEALPEPAEAEEPPLDAKPFLGRILAFAVVVLLLLATWFFGQKHLDEFYLLDVDRLILTSDKNMVTVQVISEIEDALLQVICTDSYGNSATGSVHNGFATFTDLSPNTRYTVRVEAIGWHKLLGTTSDSFTTPAQTQVLSFTAGIGPEDGSVALNFTVSGPESGNWTVLYSAEGIPEQALDFTGHGAVVSGLVPGKLYTFTLTSPDGLYMAGKTQVEFLATNILYARDLTITACGGGSLSVQWAQPEDAIVTEWRVRCFNEAGYNMTVITSELSYTFTDLDHSTACTVEVTAVGMNRSTSTSISANPVTVEGFSCDLSANGYLQVSWAFSGQSPADGWVLRWQTADGVERLINTMDAFANILALPDSSYTFTLETADGSFVFNSSHSCEALQVPLFSGYGVTATDLRWDIFIWPEDGNLELDFVPPTGENRVFALGQQAGLRITPLVPVEGSKKAVEIHFVYHDANGNVVMQHTANPTWNSLWQGDYGVIAIPAMPQEAGDYTLSVYFDGGFVHSQSFTIQEAEAAAP